MKNTTLFTFLTFCIFTLLRCQPVVPPPPMDLNQSALIPQVQSLVAKGSSFELKETTKIYLDQSDKNLSAVGQYLSERLNASTGYEFTIDKPSSKVEGIQLKIKADERFGEEAYQIEILEDGIVISASQTTGIFYGVQTLLQLLPPKIESTTLQTGPWRIATGIIKDQPTYTHRGAMLDVSRHFFEVKDVKRVIDLLARFKMNVLHLHLADDQGWRIEIKSWPNLTVHGGSTAVGGGKGGFFTQEDFKKIVEYAAARFITIVPEIDMPGHTNAALASYAELNCDGQARKLYTGMEVGFSSLCIDKEITYKFVDDVVRELAAISPGPYIHIGGDESHVTPKKDYIKFIDKVETIIRSHGKQMMGWDEITAADLEEGTVAQHWNTAENAIKAKKAGLKVVMSPAKKAYLDMKYDSLSPLGLSWAAYIEVKDAYDWNPAEYIEGLSQKDILGIEAPLWTETITTIDDIEYMMFPRLPGYAEIAWSAPSQLDWIDYKNRLAQYKTRFDEMDINFYPSKQIDWTLVERDSLNK